MKITPFGEIRHQQWKRAVFAWENGPGELVVNASGERSDFLEFLREFPNGKQCDGSGFAEDHGTFFAVACEDCYDPPIGVVKCDDCDAVDVAVDAFHWMRIDAAYAAERDSEGLRVEYSDGGNHAYDPELMRVFPIKLVRVEF